MCKSVKRQDMDFTEYSPLKMDEDELDIRQLALRRQRQKLQTPLQDDLYPDRNSPNNNNNRWEQRRHGSSVVAEMIPRNVGSYGFLEGTRTSSRTTLLALEDEGRLSRMHVPPVVKCECNGVEAIAVVSTSTIYSTISANMVDRMCLSDQVIPDTRLVSSPFGAGPQVPVKGKVKYIDLGLGSWQQVGQFYVVDASPPDVSLGVDFLRKTQSIVNFEDASLLVGGGKGARVPFLTTRDVLSMTRASHRAQLKDPDVLTAAAFF